MMATIGIDIDDVLSETILSFLDFYNKKHNTNFSFNQITDYSLSKALNIPDKDEMLNIFDFFNSDHAKNMNTTPYSKDIVHKLSKDNLLYAISSRPTQLIELTNIWLNKHYEGCFKEIILTNSSIDKSSTKSSVCISKGIDYFIEDQVIFAKDCAEVCSKVILLDKPWNRLKMNNSNIIRVKDWSCVISELIESYN
ncbi:MAG: hypothetical protein PWQ10_319 [Patescibacteria group bacterium]|nr:hypothetical protein [Patescibacteria group bacterium]